MPTEPAPRKKNDQSPLPGDVVRVATFVNLGLLGLALAILHFTQRPITAAALLPSSTTDLWRWVAVVVLGTGLLVVMSLLCEDISEDFRNIRHTLGTLLHGLPWIAVPYIAAVSAVAEELLFRGALQPWIGLEASAFIFGLLHFDRSVFSLWTLWAFAAGFLLGAVFANTQSIFPCVMIHFAVNVVGLTRAFVDRSRATEPS